MGVRRAGKFLLLLVATPLACAEVTPSSDPCGGIDCSGNGVCLSEGAAVYCRCLPGYHPVLLGCVPNDPTDPCAGVDCSGQGACRVEGTVPACTCFPGYHTTAESRLVCLPDEPGDAGIDADAPSDGEDAACPPGTTRCGTGCADTERDRDHCGRCDNPCPDGLNAVGACDFGGCILLCRPGWQDRDGTPGCEHPCAGGGSPETCNGVDDDCDGSTDEDFACAVGRPAACTTVCGTTGTGACTVACAVPAPAECTPPAEICNGIDENCDTVADDGFACAREGTGPCTTSCGSTGSRSCSADCAWGGCIPPAEACNGADDDCDGETDENFRVFRCPIDSRIYRDEGPCNAACARSEACVRPAVALSGTVTLRNCDWEGSCWPNDYVDRIVGSGDRVTIQRSNGYGYSDIGFVTLAGCTPSGTVTLRSCDWEGSCWPNDYVDRIVGSGDRVTIQRSNGYGYSDIGSITLSGCTASGTVTLRSCDWEGSCWPNDYVGRIVGSGDRLTIQRSNSYSYSDIGSITFTSTSWVCPFDTARACAGAPATCSQAAACVPDVDC
jgi:hypothetical protein